VGTITILSNSVRFVTKQSHFMKTFLNSEIASLCSQWRLYSEIASSPLNTMAKLRSWQWS